MKRPVSLVASLLLSLGVASACSAAAAGKTEIAGACSSKMGSEQGCALNLEEAFLSLTAPIAQAAGNTTEQFA